MSDKIKPLHLQRKAILYIRQSSAFQVQHNQESRRLQYAMKERLEQLGWRDVEIIDDDLGCSGTGTVQRHGFERMVAEVCLGQVGAVAAREVSRFARNSREWQQQDGVRAAFERDLEAARYEAKRAQKQYDAVDPENRLVADELERRWNAALAQVRALEQRIQEQRCASTSANAATVDEFRDLAADLDALWNNADTAVRLKKRIVRTLIHEVIANVDTAAGEVVLVIHWRGGVHTELRLPRRRRGQSNAHTSKEIVAAVRRLALICDDLAIAGVLNRNGLRTGRGNRWTRMRVTSLRNTNGIPVHRPEQQETEGWMTLTAAAKLLGISTRTLRLAIEASEIAGEHPLSDGPWILQRQALQTEAAQRVVQRARSHAGAPTEPDSDQPTLDFSNK